jgi:hypothetical protein
MVIRQNPCFVVSKPLGRKLYITTHDDQGNGTFYENNLDSYIFVIVQIRAFDVMFTGREVGHFPSMCAHAKVHAHTHPLTVSCIVLNSRNNDSVNMHTFVFTYEDIICIVTSVFFHL